MNTGPTATTGDIHINPTVVTPVPPQAVASVPRIDSFFPTSGVPGDVVNIFGAGFTDDDGFPAVTTVTFNKISALFTVITDAMILATVQPLATTGPVEVMTPGGRAASLASYVVIQRPVITTINPQTAAPGARLLITGAHFTGVYEVAFNGVAAAMFNVDSDNQITAVVPAGATSGPVTVTDRAGQATSAQTFQVIEPPVIQSFTPTSGPKGTTVTARGRHLLAVTAVKFTGTKPHRVNASFKVVDTRTLTTVVPPDAVTGPIYARNPAGVAKSQDVFMVTS